MATQGTWNIGGFNLPDLGITEALGIGTGTNWQNPNVLYPSGGSSQALPSGGGSSWGPVAGPINPNTNPIANTGGGGTGDILGTQTQTNPETQQQSGPSGQDDLNNQLNAIFSPVMEALQGQENTLNQNYSTVPGEIQNQYATSAQSLEQQKQSGLTEGTTQETQAGARKTDALTASTRLFNELQRGGQQRFGGASSAGEAYQSLTAVEQQRRQGTIQGAFETAMQQIGTFKQNIIDKAQIAFKELENQKQAALNDAQRSFRDALQQIQSMRAQAQSDKATASMNALNDLRNRVYAVNTQSLQFAQQLAANNQLSLKAVDDYTAKMQQSVGGMQVIGTNFANQATTNPQTSYGISAGQTAPTNNFQQLGQIQSRPGQRWDSSTGTWVTA